jgi:Concanavalin A-like lectin/glucanases superfamily
LPCTAPVRGKTDAKYPWDPDITNDPCGAPEVYASGLCRLHWQLANGQFAGSLSPLTSEMLADGPLFWYRLDETSGLVLKDAVGGPDGAYTAGAVKGQPPVVSGGGFSADFPTNAEYASTPDSVLNSITGTITLEAWVRVRQYPTQTPALTIYMIQKGSAYQLRMDDFGGGPIFSIFLWDPSAAVWGASSAAGSRPVVGNIFHVVGTWDGANVRIYVNGALINSAAWAGPVIVDNAGAFGIGPGPVILDEVAVYNKALAADRILAHYNAGKGIPNAGNGYSQAVQTDYPRGYWRLNETSGTTAADSSGRGQTGTYQGGFTLAQPGATKDDAAVRLNGTTGMVAVPDSAVVDLGDVLTIEAWVKPDDASQIQTIVSKLNGAYQVRFVPVSGSLYMQVLAQATASIGQATVPLPLDGNFHHVVYTKNGVTSKFYQDGVDITPTITNATMVDNALQLNIGSENGAGFNNWKGVIDEVALYPTALSAARVLAHYNARNL